MYERKWGQDKQIGLVRPLGDIKTVNYSINMNSMKTMEYSSEQTSKSYPGSLYEKKTFKPILYVSITPISKTEKIFLYDNNHLFSKSHLTWS